MIVKAVIVVCVVSAAAGKNMDSIVASTFGSTEPSGATVGTTTEDLDAVLEGIFGSTKSSEATSATTEGVKDVDAVIDEIFGSTKSSEATKSTTEGNKDEIFGSTKSSEATPTWATTEGIKTYGPCVSSEGEKGECVPYYNCEIKPLNDDEYYIDIHLPVDSPCESHLDVCCSPSNRIELATKPAAVGENSEPPKLHNKSSTVQ